MPGRIQKGLLLLLLSCSLGEIFAQSKENFAETRGLPLYYWDARQHYGFSNFGDALSEALVERIVGHRIEILAKPYSGKKKLLALGSIIHFAEEGDVIWGAGINGKYSKKEDYRFSHLDIRAVRGPLTRQCMLDMGIDCPEIYGDPTLLLPKIFSEFQRSVIPSKDYIIIPHYSDESLFLNRPNIVSVKEDWKDVVRKILDSKFVISTSLSGVIVAEAFGIPARLLCINNSGNTEDLFKYKDYYYGTNRFNFRYATTIEEALEMGGEVMPECDLEKLYQAFPFDAFLEGKSRF